jgi:hypothetical protein
VVFSKSRHLAMLLTAACSSIEECSRYWMESQGPALVGLVSGLEKEERRGGDFISGLRWKKTRKNERSQEQ